MAKASLQLLNIIVIPHSKKLSPHVVRVCFWNQRFLFSPLDSVAMAAAEVEVFAPSAHCGTVSKIEGANNLWATTIEYAIILQSIS